MADWKGENNDVDWREDWRHFLSNAFYFQKKARMQRNIHTGMSRRPGLEMMIKPRSRKVHGKKSVCLPFANDYWVIFQRNPLWCQLFKSYRREQPQAMMVMARLGCWQRMRRGRKNDWLVGKEYGVEGRRKCQRLEILIAISKITWCSHTPRLKTLPQKPKECGYDRIRTCALKEQWLSRPSE